jgi:hypothetical protein
VLVVMGRLDRHLDPRKPPVDTPEK